MKPALEFTDLEGQTFGELTVLWKHKKSNNGGASWVCRCSCGHLDIYSGDKLRSGHITHCRFCNMGRFVFHDHYNTVECVLPGGNSFFVDFEDLPLVMGYKWHRTGNGYYKASLGSRKKGHILLHRLIMKPPDHMVVDHIDGDKTNCRKSNLRICSQAENSRNARISKNNCCGKKGVHYDARRKRWYARIHKGLTYSLGGYESCDSAARAYDAAAEELHGEYSKTNKELGLLGGSG